MDETAITTDAPLSSDYLDGYTRGIQTGIEQGYQQAMADFLGMRTFVQSLQGSRRESWAEMERRRHTYQAPALTAEQIHRNAAASWGLASERQQSA